MRAKRRPTRAEHLAWCKARALEHLPGDPQQAFRSLACDLDKHPGTASRKAADLYTRVGLKLLLTVRLCDAETMRRFIERFR